MVPRAGLVGRPPAERDSYRRTLTHSSWVNTQGRWYHSVRRTLRLFDIVQRNPRHERPGDLCRFQGLRSGGPSSADFIARSSRPIESIRNRFHCKERSLPRRSMICSTPRLGIEPLRLIPAGTCADRYQSLGCARLGRPSRRAYQSAQTPTGISGKSSPVPDCSSSAPKYRWRAPPSAWQTRSGRKRRWCR